MAPLRENQLSISSMFQRRGFNSPARRPNAWSACFPHLALAAASDGEIPRETAFPDEYITSLIHSSFTSQYQEIEFVPAES